MTDHQPPTVDRGVVVPRGYEALAQGFATTVSDGNTDPAKRRAWVKIEFRGVDACALAGHSMDYLDALVKADIAPAQSPAALDGRHADLEALVSACEAEFTSAKTEGDSFTYSEPDDSEVSYPSSNITFGHIRRAREALTAPAALDEAVGLLRGMVNGVHVEGEKGGRRSWSLRLQMASAYDAARAFLANLEPSQ